MLEFFWSGSNKPAPADSSAAPGEPAQATDPMPARAIVAPPGAHPVGAEEPDLSPPSSQSELPEPRTPPAVERLSEEEVSRQAASREHLPTALELARRTGRRRGRRLVKPAVPTPPLTAQQRLLLLDTW